MNNILKHTIVLKNFFPAADNIHCCHSVQIGFSCSLVLCTCHILCRKDIPVVASHKAAIRVQKLGFTSVYSLEHGTSTTHIPGLQIWATVGARVGPPWAPRENGFVLEELETGLRIYYEPHCSFDASSVKAVGLGVCCHTVVLRM
jgi:hypothetical protein